MTSYVLLADANRQLAEVMRQLLSDEPDLRVVDVVHSADAAMVAVRRHRPDVVLVDPRLRQGSGFELCAALHDAAPETAVLLWSYSQTAGQCRDRSVTGVLERGMTFAELVGAIRAALQQRTAAEPTHRELRG